MLAGGQKSFVMLEDRGVVRVAGEAARDFLQGLVTNDVAQVAPDRAVWAALLTAQGKYLHDFFIVEIDGALMLDCEAARAEDLVRRLARYRLRRKIEIEDVSGDWAVAALIGTEGDGEALAGYEGKGGPFAGGVCYVDPRYAGIGARALLPRAAVPELEAAGFRRTTPGDYDHARLCAGLPDGSRDLAPEKAFLLESGFDALNGIAWKKGCYVGQELTARMRYRGSARKRLLPVTFEGPAPAPGTPIRLGRKTAGEMRSSAANMGLALLRIDALEALHAEGGEMRAGETAITPLRPPWLAAERDPAPAPDDA